MGGTGPVGRAAVPATARDDGRTTARPRTRPDLLYVHARYHYVQCGRACDWDSEIQDTYTYVRASCCYRNIPLLWPDARACDP
jgi:hypothetical protein